MGAFGSCLAGKQPLVACGGQKTYKLTYPRSLYVGLRTQCIHLQEAITHVLGMCIHVSNGAGRVMAPTLNNQLVGVWLMAPLQCQAGHRGMWKTKNKSVSTPNIYLKGISYILGKCWWGHLMTTLPRQINMSSREYTFRIFEFSSTKFIFFEFSRG